MKVVVLVDRFYIALYIIIHRFYMALFSALQALVYDILPSTTAVFSYARGSRKLSAVSCWFPVVGLLQTTQIKQGESFIAPTKFTPAQIKTQSFESRRNSFFLPGVDASHVYVRALALGCVDSHISTRTFQRALTASLDSCAETKSAPSVA